MSDVFGSSAQSVRGSKFLYIFGDLYIIEHAYGTYSLIRIQIPRIRLNAKTGLRFKQKRNKTTDEGEISRVLWEEMQTSSRRSAEGVPYVYRLQIKKMVSQNHQIIFPLFWALFFLSWLIVLYNPSTEIKLEFVRNRICKSPAPYGTIF